MNEGDFDDMGNLITYHPECHFCKSNFYNLEDFNTHLRDKHYKCDVCGDDHKYLFYKDYEELRKHSERSHFKCTDTECKQNKFIYFKNREELHEHIDVVHRGHKVKNVKALTGFYLEGQNPKQQPIMQKVSL